MRLLTVVVLVFVFGCGVEKIERRSGNPSKSASSDQSASPPSPSNSQSTQSSGSSSTNGLDQSRTPSVNWDGSETLGNATYQLKAVE